MSLLKLNNKFLKLNNKLEVLNPIIQTLGVFNFNNAAYVELASNPDLSGNKTIRWKMWIDNSGTSLGSVFALGNDGDAIQIRTSSGMIRCSNTNRVMGTNGEKQVPFNDAICGYVLDCIAVKTSNQFLWFQVGGFSSGDQGLGSSGSVSTNSRFGADGASSPSAGCFGMYVWNVQVENTGGSAIGAWSGYGTAPNTSAEWIDTVGSDNGTVVYTSGIKDVTNPTLITDWFMPSRDEVAAMRTNLHLLGYGGFNNAKIYFSSSETSATNAYAEQFSSGTIISVVKTASSYYSRAARKFTAGVGAYNLTDLGPAGGRIFYIDGGTTYYEAAPTDSVFGTFGGNGQLWCNITNGTSGASGTAIGTGITNTPLIIAQSGHIYSHANACHNLSVKI